MLVLLCLLSFTFACERNEKNIEHSTITLRNFDKKVGTRFTPLPFDIFKAPSITELIFPYADNVDAIWGATGSDDQGNIYFGASSHGGDYHSAYLYQYNPSNGQINEQSDVLSELKRHGLFKPGMGQNKLHSKFYQANDGYIYFSSFDEGGENEGVNPTWGGHLWRKKPNETRWQHLLATEEALVAVNTNGQYIYALGYWNHVLYQYDTKTKKTKRVVVGSYGEHVSRNFLVDERGHAYVPQVIENEFDEIEAYLNEYDVNLRLVSSSPMVSYQAKNMKRHHGIVGYTSLNNGDLVFTTSEGGLYKVTIVNKDNKLTYLGNMHPDGQAYIPSLFTLAGQDFIVGVARIEKKWQWLIYDLKSQEAVNLPLRNFNKKQLLLYGSLTKDDKGNFYIGGRAISSEDKKLYPLMLKFSLN